MDKTTISQRLAEFTERTGITCTLIGVRPHPYKDNTAILTLREADLLAIDREVKELKNCLCGEVFEFDFGPSEIPNSAEFSYCPWEATEK